MSKNIKSHRVVEVVCYYCNFAVKLVTVIVEIHIYYATTKKQNTILLSITSPNHDKFYARCRYCYRKSSVRLLACLSVCHM